MIVAERQVEEGQPQQGEDEAVANHRLLEPFSGQGQDTTSIGTESQKDRKNHSSKVERSPMRRRARRRRTDSDSGGRSSAGVTLSLPLSASRMAEASAGLSLQGLRVIDFVPLKLIVPKQRRTSSIDMQILCI